MHSTYLENKLNISTLKNQFKIFIIFEYLNISEKFSKNCIQKFALVLAFYKFSCVNFTYFKLNQTEILNRISPNC